jgi:hypothetical protein
MLVEQSRSARDHAQMASRYRKTGFRLGYIYVADSLFLSERPNAQETVSRCLSQSLHLTSEFILSLQLSNDDSARTHVLHVKYVGKL